MIYNLLNDHAVPLYLCIKIGALHSIIISIIKIYH